jgi:hypothetical protein
VAGLTAADRRRGSDQLLVAALAGGATQAEAGAAAGVSERTVRRRLADPGFADRVREERSALVARIGARLTGLTVHAVDALAELLAAGVADGVRLRTALGVLDSSRTWRDAGEVEERLRAVEQALTTPDLIGRSG